MKRKRGNKKGKSKGTTAAAAKESISNKGSQIVEDLSGLDDHENDNDNDSVMEVEVESTPSSTATDQHKNVASIDADGSIDKAMGKSVRCVKVKLKTSKTLDPRTTALEAPMQSDTDRSSQQMGLEKKSLTVEKMEDSANSVPEIKMLVSRPASKKSGSIKIKSSKSEGDGENQAKNDGLPLGESFKFRQDARYNKQELSSALMVIKKVMKMDAAEPFNVPVNPVALGIPDYFDVIDTPMDFGTICSTLESGVKYMNSEDVFKDVQYIWGNCYKYNNKGDYILDLMRRVKKNFSKYWTAAGLYTAPPKGANSIKENVGPCSPGKILAKGGQSKHKSWKRNGRRHKHDCLCAVCILKRRRREREASARIAKGLSGARNNDAQEFKQEGSSPIESLCAEDSSSNLDDMIDQEVDDGVEEVGVKSKKDVSKSQYITPEKQEEAEEEQEEEEDEIDGEDAEDDEEEEEEGVEEEEGEGEGEDEEEEEKEKAVKKEARAKAPEESEKKLMMQHNCQSLDDGQIDSVLPQMQEPRSVDHQQRKDSQQVYKKAKVLNGFGVENPMIMDLCRILFPDDPKSVWNGPHSLGRAKHDQRHAPPTSSIRAAIDTFFK